AASIFRTRNIDRRKRIAVPNLYRSGSTGVVVQTGVPLRPPRHLSRALTGKITPAATARRPRAGPMRRLHDRRRRLRLGSTPHEGEEAPNRNAKTWATMATRSTTSSSPSAAVLGTGPQNTNLALGPRPQTQTWVWGRGPKHKPGVWQTSPSHA